MQPRIKGASLEQRRLLDDILADFGSTRIARVEIRPYQPTSEGGDLPLPGDHGDEISVASQPEDPRGRWEGELLSVAFARRSKAAGLRKVVRYAYSDGAKTLEHAWPPIDMLAANELDRFATDVAAAAHDATLETFEVLRPQAHAVALAIRVEEPHWFLRFTSMDFLKAVAEWRDRCDGIYGEIRDAERRPALTFGWFRGGGFGSTRHDVECCAPFLGLSHPIDWQGPPPCPVLDRP